MTPAEGHGPQQHIELHSVTPGERGVTVIADRVVEKIATRAVDDTDHAGGASRRVLGVPVARASLDSAPRVRTEIDGGLVTLGVTISVSYPTPAGAVAGEVRRRVIDRVHTLTGLDVREVDVDISRLASEQPRRRVQ
jgi:uncharacterized alkaline shock family protein YloU